MRILLALLIFTLFAGCQTRPSLTKQLPPPAPEPRAIAAMPMTPAPASNWEQRLRQQRQLAEALMSQNDALQEQLREALAKPPPAPPPVSAPTTLLAVASTGSAINPAAPPPDEPPTTVLVPNADGLIDLVAARTAITDEPVNPFAVRTAVAGDHETVLTVQGVIAGERPCALVNDRLLAVGDTVESLRLVRVEPDALLFVAGGFTLRIPVGGQPVRIRRA